ncbi:MAG: hypothetical protein ACLVKO_12960 [Dysgonomonas sp.]
MEEGSKAGKVARNYFSDIIDEVSTKFELCRGEVSQWQNSGTFVSYFWCQLKRKQYENSNISISIFAEKADIRRFERRKTKGLKAALKFAKEHDMCMTEAQIQGANNM